MKETVAIAGRRPGKIERPDRDLNVCVDRTVAALSLAIWMNEKLRPSKRTTSLLRQQKEALAEMRERSYTKTVFEIINNGNKRLNEAAHEVLRDDARGHGNLNNARAARVVEHVKGRAA